MIEKFLQPYTGGGIAYELLTARRFKNPKCLDRYGFKVYSQNDEDGIIEEIFNRIGTTNKIFVEFGVGDGLECNSHYLLHKGWSGLWMEGNPDACKAIAVRFLPLLQKGQLKIGNVFITKDNINELIKAGGIVGEIDLLSVDIDGNDWHVWKAINVIQPRAVIVAYNAKFPPNYAWVMPYNENHSYDGSDCHFVKQELAKGLFVEPATAEELYNPFRYITGQRYNNGHPSRYFLMNHLSIQ